jgi:hypothetical protein
VAFEASRRRSELDQRPEWHPFEVQAGGGDVLAQVARCDLEASFREECKELGWDRVDLSEIGRAGLATSEIAMPDERGRRLGCRTASAAIGASTDIA